MKGLQDLNFKNYLDKLKSMDWLHYKMYIVGGILEGWETKDIDICVKGNRTSMLPNLLNEARSLGPFDMYWVESLLKTDEGGYSIYKFAKSYDRGSSRALQRKGYWDKGLFWQKFEKPLNIGKRNKVYTKEPLLIYDKGFVI